MIRYLILLAPLLIPLIVYLIWFKLVYEKLDDDSKKQKKFIFISYVFILNIILVIMILVVMTLSNNATFDQNYQPAEYMEQEKSLEPAKIN